MPSVIAVGLTGGVACGKSTVAGLFRRKGAKALDTDRIVHGLMKRGTPEYRKLLKRFGSTILTPEKTISRRRLKKLVMARPEVLSVLERILHPGVRHAVRERVRKLGTKRGLLIIEVPLLFETGFDRLTDFTIAVTATLKRQRAYACKKGFSREVLKRFSGRQWSLKRKASASDFVIRNNGSLNDLNRQINIIKHSIETKGE